MEKINGMVGWMDRRRQRRNMSSWKEKWRIRGACKKEKRCKRWNQILRTRRGKIGGRAGKSVLAVNIHFRDKSSSYTIYSVALQMKASGPALQSDQPCVSPLLPLAGIIFPASQQSDAHYRALWNKQCYKALCTIG